MSWKIGDEIKLSNYHVLIVGLSENNVNIMVTDKKGVVDYQVHHLDFLKGHKPLTKLEKALK